MINFAYFLSSIISKCFVLLTMLLLYSILICGSFFITSRMSLSLKRVLQTLIPRLIPPHERLHNNTWLKGWLGDTGLDMLLKSRYWTADLNSRRASWIKTLNDWCVTLVRTCHLNQGIERLIRIHGLEPATWITVCMLDPYSTAALLKAQLQLPELLQTCG